MRACKVHARRVNLTKYLKVRGAASETWRFCPVVHTGNGRIQPDYVLINGRHCVEGCRATKPSTHRVRLDAE
jgi:hypothetical protein